MAILGDVLHAAMECHYEEEHFKRNLKDILNYFAKCFSLGPSDYNVISSKSMLLKKLLMNKIWKERI